MVVNHEGEIERRNATRRRVEGSHDATIGVSSVTLPDCSASLPLGKVSHLAFSGNPVKFLQGHNVFGTDCLRTLVYRTVIEVMPILGFSDFQLALAVHAIDNFNFVVSRIDITKIMTVGNGTNEDLEAYLYMLPQLMRARGGRISCVNGTTYVGQKSTLWSAKIYNKYLELMKGHKGHALPVSLKNTALIEFCRGQARIEIVIRKKMLTQIGATCPRFLQKNLDAIYADLLGRIDMNNQSVNTGRIDHIPRHLQSTYLLWKQGEDLKNILPKPTFYRHKRDLMTYGIDIALPPVRDENRTCHAVSLHRVLSPRAVTQVPASLMKYMIQQEARYAA